MAGVHSNGEKKLCILPFIFPSPIVEEIERYKGPPVMNLDERYIRLHFEFNSTS